MTDNKKTVLITGNTKGVAFEVGKQFDEQNYWFYQKRDIGNSFGCLGLSIYHFSVPL